MTLAETFPNLHARLLTREGMGAVLYSARLRKGAVAKAPSVLAFVIVETFGELPVGLEEATRAAMELALLMAVHYAARARRERKVWNWTKFRYFALRAA